MVPDSLKRDLAILLRVKATELSLHRIETGLSHLSYICRVSGQRCFVKVYTPGEDTAGTVEHINRITVHMRNQGVPASRVIRHSPRFANIVVHEFVEGEIATGDITQIDAIARLYSQVALIGAEHGINLVKTEYLSDIGTIINATRNVNEMDVAADASIQAGVLNLAERADKFLRANLPEEGLFHFHMHDDFTEKNILMKAGQVKLLCDWDSYRVKFLPEHIACTACRFSTGQPLNGVLQAEKLLHFLRSLDSKVLSYISDPGEFAQQFPVLATLKHLRTYPFRNSVVRQGRPDLKTPLLAWPLEHCLWLMENRQKVSDWVHDALLADQTRHVSSY